MIFRNENQNKALALFSVVVVIVSVLYLLKAKEVCAQPVGANTSVCTGSVNHTWVGNGASGSVNWTVSGIGQNAYYVQIDNNSNFSSPERDSSIVVTSTNSYSFTNLPSGTYYWRVMVRSTASGVFYWTPWANADNSFNVSPPPTVDLKINGSNGPISILQGNNLNLTWTSTNATTCSATGAGWIGTKGVSGSENVAATLDSTYTLSCTGLGGNASDGVSVDVSCIPSCGAWGDCSARCGGGTQTRTCIDASCNPYTQTQNCNSHGCSGSWKEVPPN